MRIPTRPPSLTMLARTTLALRVLLLAGPAAAPVWAQAPQVIVKQGPLSPVAPHPATSLPVDPGYKLLSGGAMLHWQAAGSLLDQSRPRPGVGLSPFFDPISWEASGKDHVYPEPTSIGAYAVLLHDPNELYGVVVVEAQSPPLAKPSVRATLPPGYVMTGGGCFADWRSQPPAQGHLLTGSYPDETDFRSWICESTEHLVSNPASLRAYVIGIRPRLSSIPLPVLSIVKGTSATGSSPVAQAVVTPSPGLVVTGGGARATPAPAQLATGGAAATATWSGTRSLSLSRTPTTQLLTASFPIQSPTSPASPIGWEARSKEHGVSSPATVTAYALALRFSTALADPRCACNLAGAFPRRTLHPARGLGSWGAIPHPLGGFVSWHDKWPEGRLELRDPAGNVVLNESKVWSWGLSPDQRFFVVVAMTPAASGVAKVYRMALGPRPLPLVMTEPIPAAGFWSFSEDGSLFLIEELNRTTLSLSVAAFNLNAPDPLAASFRFSRGGLSAGSVEVSPCGDRVKVELWDVSQRSAEMRFYSRKGFGTLEAPVLGIWDGVTRPASVRVQAGGPLQFQVAMTGFKTRSGQTAFASLQCEAP